MGPGRTSLATLTVLWWTEEEELFNLINLDTVKPAVREQTRYKQPYSSDHLSQVIARGTSWTDDKMEDNGLPSIHRYITTHDDHGKAVFHTSIPERLPLDPTDQTARFGLGYVTDKSPVDFTGEVDLATYQKYQAKPPGIVIPGGTVLRIVDIAPGQTSPMHRTVSLDYGVVLEGVVELILDSGEVRTMNRGDVAVQRGTMHAWRNAAGGDRWARMLYVLQESKPIEVEGGKLGEDYGGMKGVRPSGH